MITLLLGMTLLASNPIPVYIDKPPIQKRWEPRSVKNRRAVEGWLKVPRPSPELRRYMDEKNGAGVIVSTDKLRTNAGEHVNGRVKPSDSN